MTSNFDIIKGSLERLKCKVCNGKGSTCHCGDPLHDSVECKFCNGTGWKSAKPKKLIHDRSR